MERERGLMREKWRGGGESGKADACMRGFRESVRNPAGGGMMKMSRVAPS